MENGSSEDLVNSKLTEAAILNYNGLSYLKSPRNIFLLIIAIVLLSCIIFYKDFRNYFGINPIEIINNQESKNSNYRNEVLGFSFKFPKIMGIISTDPKYVTSLQKLADEITTDADHSVISNSVIKINFSNGEYHSRILDLSVQAFSNEYFKSHYNTLEDMKTNSICDYQLNNKDNIEYRGERGYIQQYGKEIFTSCEDGVKVSLIEVSQYYDNNPETIFYSYYLEYLNLTKLNNGVYDYLLSSYIVASGSMLETQLTWPQFADRAGISAMSLPDLPYFKSLVGSIDVFTPKKINNVVKVFNDSDNNIVIIKTFWNLLQSGNLEKANSLLQTPNISIKWLQNNFKDLYVADPKDFKKIGSDKYTFVVDLQKQNSEPTSLNFLVMIVNGKIQINTAQKIDSAIAVYGNKKAYSASRMVLKDESTINNAKDVVVLEDGDKETIVEECGRGCGKVSFSSSGNYLLYQVYSWEWSNLALYSINNKKSVLIYASSNDGNFNSNETVYYSCSNGSEFSGKSAVVYSLPNLELTVDMFKKYPDLENVLNIDCKPNEKDHLLMFNFYGKYDKSSRLYDHSTTTHVVNLDTGEFLN